MKNKFSTFIISMLINVFCCVPSYAQKNSPTDLDQTSNIKTILSLKEACHKFNEQLLINIDQVYYFKDCSLHLISNIELVNTLIQIQQKKPLTLSQKVYSSLPITNNYTFEDYYKEYIPHQKEFSIKICEKFDQKIVSVDDFSYFYIEACKKRKFKNYDDVQKFNALNNSIYAIPEFELSLFQEGKPMLIDSKTKNTQEISEVDVKKNLPKKERLCKNLNHKIASFYNSFYYIHHCILFPMSDLSLDLQQTAQQQGGIQDLTLQQVLGLEEGKTMTSVEVLKLIK